MLPADNPVTQLLSSTAGGDEGARRELWTIIYDELHSMAKQQMACEAPGRTLAPTALVHEAYFRLFGQDAAAFANRRHFFAAAAKTMRRIRIDDARSRNRLKRGGGLSPDHGTQSFAVWDQDPAVVLAVDEALAGLEATDPRKAEIVTMRFFAGMTVKEIAAALDVSPRTVDYEWRFARAWLQRELSKGDTKGLEV